MIVRNKSSKQKQELPVEIVEYINQICPLSASTYTGKQTSDIVLLLQEEYKKLQKDYDNWLTTVRNLDAVPSKDFFLSPENLKFFDIEEEVITDTEKVKVIVYNIQNPEFIQQIIKKKQSKSFIVLKFISPRTIEELVNIQAFYQKILDLCQQSINALKKCNKGIIIDHQSSNNRQGSQQSLQNSEATDRKRI